MFSQIKVWSRKWNDSEFFSTEYRIYVDMLDGRSGCLYLTGNPYHPEGEIEGKLKAGEWDSARTLAVWDGKWHTLRKGEIAERERILSVQPNQKTGKYEALDRWDYLEIR